MADRLTHWLFVPDRSCAFQIIVASPYRFGQVHVEGPAPDPDCWKKRGAWSFRTAFGRSRWTFRAREEGECNIGERCPALLPHLVPKFHSDGGACNACISVLGYHSILSSCKLSTLKIPCEWRAQMECCRMKWTAAYRSS